MNDKYDGPAVVAATDIELSELAGRRFTICTGERRVVAASDPEKYAELRHVVTDIVPKLSRSAPLAEQLTAAEVDRLRPYLKQLDAIGVLLFPTVDITTAADRRLYSFICRRATDPDQVYAAVRAKRVELSGTAELTGAAGQALAAQGIRVGPGDAPPALTVVASVGEEPLLAANREACRDGRALLPILVGPHQVRLGPWTVPGETACLTCFGPGADGAPATCSRGWLTLQPGCAGWVGGLVAHLVLRAFVPSGGHHPWGTVTTVDAVRGEQAVVRAWRDPYCPDCASRAPLAQEWVEA